MNIFKSCKDRLLDFKKDDFEQLAFEIYRMQAVKNQVYNEYHAYLGKNPQNIHQLEDIPFLPIEFFKSHEIKTYDWASERIFNSSGTTGQISSQHHILDLEFYKKISLKNFEYVFGPISDYNILALLPSYLERDDSSLVYMVDHFIERSASGENSFYLNDFDRLLEDLTQLKGGGKKIMLWGVSFALLDLIENYGPDLNGVMVVETGGMKGRRKEMTKQELHELIMHGLNVEQVYSEYGMTELLSQGYSLGEGVFSLPPWMRIQIREINDPFDRVEYGNGGGMNIIDLSNFHSCSFIETKDIGRLWQDGTFEVLGRYDNSDIRGCNLLIN